MLYAENFKQAMVQKLLLPGGPSVLSLSRETGVSEQSLYNWKAKYQNAGSGQSQRSPRQWKNEDKYEALLETAKLTGEDLGKWLRVNGLRSEHIEIWRQEMKKNLNQQKKNTELKEAKKRIKELERELLRKDKALAEMSALVVLKKKVELLWGDEET